MLSHLPSEILNHICHYLSPTDCCQLTLVNNAFHSLFIPILYRKVKIDSKNQFSQFISTTKHHSHVRVLEIDTISTLKAHLPHLPAMCPHLTSLSLHMDASNDTKLSRVFETVMEDYLPSLLSLSIHQKRPPVVFEELMTLQLSSNRPLSILEMAPYVTELHLTWTDTTPFSIHHLKSIHHTCPRLQHVTVSAYTTMGPTERDIDLMPSFDQLEFFELNSREEAEHCYPWLHCVAKAYPNLKTLTLKTLSTSFTRKQCSAEMYDLIWSGCLPSVQFNWINTRPDDMLIVRLDPQQRTSMVIKEINSDGEVFDLTIEEYETSKYRFTRCEQLYIDEDGFSRPCGTWSVTSY
ncbi:hypothetical protein EDC96DRAFT_512547 [Choanephora cucurbitarum]|nr:hypothetical protein EDC96DRAFT_512547 [Choanephora cucurbitarum]